MKPRTRLMLTVALGLFAALVVLATIVHLLQPRFAFFPMAGESVTPRDFGVDYDSAAVRTRDGERLCSWSLAGPATRARIVYFHGNGGNLSTWAPIVAGIARRGYSVFAFDYRGYGISTGRPTEQGMYRDKALFDTIAAPKQFVTVRGGDHNDLAPPDPDVYWEAVGRFIESLPVIPFEQRTSKAGH